MSDSRWRVPGAVILVAMSLCAACKRSGESNVAQPPAVAVATPAMQRVADYLDFTGNTAAFNSVTLVARVEGYLEKVHFTDGTLVKKGDLLFTIQQDQYKAQLEQAQAQVETQKVAVWHATTELGRYSSLVKQDAATQTTVDHWQAEKETAEANLLAAKAQVELAELNLSYTLVKAPFDGRIGRHLVDPGNLVGTMGQPTSLAQIDQVDPIYVYFTIDERDLLRIMQRRQAVGAAPVTEGTTPASFGLLSEEGFPHQGYLDFASISVAPTTGTLHVRGVFPNKDSSVLPGLFVRVHVAAPQEKEALLVPGEAVSFDQQGEYVLVVNAKNIVERRTVKTGIQVGDSLVVENGLKPDDRVVVEGLLQAIPGRQVSPQQVAPNSTPSANASAPG